MVVEGCGDRVYEGGDQHLWRERETEVVVEGCGDRVYEGGDQHLGRGRRGW